MSFLMPSFRGISALFLSIGFLQLGHISESLIEKTSIYSLLRISLKQNGHMFSGNLCIVLFNIIFHNS